MSTKPIKKADLVWEKKCHPHSLRFDDHYYSLVNGLDESTHVFIKGNNLEYRWQQLLNDQTFTIMETGFGSGLNFLVTWQLWNRLNINKSNHLHFISVEAYPMSSEQLAKSLLNWKDLLTDLPKKLIKQYPPLVIGEHQLNFTTDNVTLTLIFSDISELITSLHSKSFGVIDAWYLDGFAPSKNPDMWQCDLFKQMYKSSGNHSTVATYSVAGIVRRGLTDAGYTICRKPGFGTKREMLTAWK